MSTSETEYEKLFSKFYGDLFKYQSGKKTHLRCPGCQSEKRFIINEDNLIFSCGPNSSDNPKCGKQYTITLPKYIHFRTLQKLYEEQMNGSFNYQEKDRLQYDLKSLGQRMDVNKELEEQNKRIKESTDSLNRLISDYIEINKLNGYIETLETLSEKRYKNSIEKKKLMRLLNEGDLSEPEKNEIRKKYAVLIHENKEFIDMIIELRQPNQEFIMSEKPKVIIHSKNLNIESVEDSKIPKMTKTEKTRKAIWGILYIMYEINQMNSVTLTQMYNKIPLLKEITGLFEGTEPTNNIRERLSSGDGKNMMDNGYVTRVGEKGSGTYKLTEKGNQFLNQMNTKYKNEENIVEVSEKTEEKTSFDDQVKILKKFYEKVDPKKTETDIIRLINNRRPKDTPKGSRIPTKQWLELCDKLKEKYIYHPLRFKEEKDKFIKKLDDGTSILVDSLSPESPR